MKLVIHVVTIFFISSYYNTDQTKSHHSWQEMASFDTFGRRYVSILIFIDHSVFLCCVIYIYFNSQTMIIQLMVQFHANYLKASHGTR